MYAMLKMPLGTFKITNFVEEGLMLNGLKKVVDLMRTREEREEDLVREAHVIDMNRIVEIVETIVEMIVEMTKEMIKEMIREMIGEIVEGLDQEALCKLNR
jgi:hypothetical protein